MSRLELGTAALTIACMAWAQIYHWRADRRTDTEERS